jgi:hypothetical protein
VCVRGHQVVIDQLRLQGGGGREATNVKTGGDCRSRRSSVGVIVGWEWEGTEPISLGRVACRLSANSWAGFKAERAGRTPGTTGIEPETSGKQPSWSDRCRLEPPSLISNLMLCARAGGEGARMNRRARTKEHQAHQAARLGLAHLDLPQPQLHLQRCIGWARPKLVRKVSYKKILNVRQLTLAPPPLTPPAALNTLRWTKKGFFLLF